MLTCALQSSRSDCSWVAICRSNVNSATPSTSLTLTSKAIDLHLNVEMSNQPPGKQSKKSSLLRPFKGLLSRRSRSPSSQGTQSVTPRNASSSISAASATQDDPQAPPPQSVTSHIASASKSPSATNYATSAPQINPEGTEYTAILELSTTSGSLSWEHQMKEWGSTAYEGLKMAIQGIYDCSGIFPPLQAAAGVLLTISKVVDVRGSMCSKCKYVINFSFYPSESFSE